MFHFLSLGYEKEVPTCLITFNWGTLPSNIFFLFSLFFLSYYPGSNPDDLLLLTIDHLVSGDTVSSFFLSFAEVPEGSPDLNSGPRYSSSPSHNKSCQLTRDPPDGCEKVKTIDDPRSVSRSVLDVFPCKFFSALPLFKVQQLKYHLASGGTSDSGDFVSFGAHFGIVHFTLRILRTSEMRKCYSLSHISKGSLMYPRATASPPLSPASLSPIIRPVIYHLVIW